MKTWKLVLRYMSSSLPKRMLCAQFALTFLIALPIICYNLPWSAYYRPYETSYARFVARNADERRTALAETYLGQKTKHHDFPYQYGKSSSKKPDESSVNSSPKPPVTSNDLRHPAVALVMMAVDRNRHAIDAYEPHYLTQSLVALFKSLDVEQRDHQESRFRAINISICNTDLLPTQFGEANRLSKFATQFWRSSEQLLIAKKLTEKRNCLAKLDLAFCLKEAALRNPDADYLVLVEDDMVARKNFISALYDILAVRMFKRFRGHSLRRIGYIQLYSPLKHYNYKLFDSSTWVELFFVSTFGTFILLLCCYRLHLRPYNLPQNILLIAILFTYCLVIALLIGRQHLLGTRHAFTQHYSQSDPIVPGFSSGVLPRTFALDMAAFLNKSTNADVNGNCKSGVDKMTELEQFVLSQGRRIFSMYPNPLHHIGLYSHYQKRTVDQWELDQ